MEDTADHSVSQPRYAPAYVLNGKAERQGARILPFDAVIKYGHADGCAFFSVVGVYDGIDNCLAKGNHLSNLRHVGAPICGSQANEDARFRPKMLKVVGERQCEIFTGLDASPR